MSGYDESSIRTLDDIEHIRLRPGMYVGSLESSAREDGLYVLLKEVIDNSIDEFVMGFGATIEVECSQKCVRVRDYGRGIPQKKLIDCVSKSNTGAKFDTSAFEKAIGMNGVGITAVNALSERFEAKSYRDGKCAWCLFEKGSLKGKGSKKSAEKTGTEIIFTPDSSDGMFGDYAYRQDIVEEMIFDYACLNSGLTFILNGKKIRKRNGLADLLSVKIADAKSIYDIAHYSSRRKDIEIAFTHIADDQENCFSYANGQYTSQGGVHLSAFREGIVKGISEIFRKDWSAQDIRSGLAAAVAVRLDDARFDGQTKNRLTSSEIKTKVMDFAKECAADYFLKNAKSAQALKEKIIRTEKLRKEIQELRKSAKSSQAKARFNIPNLKDCRYHLNDKGTKGREKGDKSMIFICEGNSAAGSFIPTRDAETQAVFPVRGKVKNVEKGMTRKSIYENEELYNLTSALGVERDDKALRYGKIIIATDADYDGYHIRLLLMTFFIRCHKELLREGRVHILETPLFKVRNSTRIEYCYSDREKNIALEKLGRGAEVTRFKGLGEIDPSDFRKFISPESIVLIPVTLDGDAQAESVVEFYMGGNSAKRRDFIMDNLIDDVG